MVVAKGVFYCNRIPSLNWSIVVESDRVYFFGVDTESTDRWKFLLGRCGQGPHHRV